MKKLSKQLKLSLVKKQLENAETDSQEATISKEWCKTD